MGIKEMCKRWVHGKRGEGGGMCWDERKLHWKVRMIYILGKIEMTKVTCILGQRE
jgi:hypothetical protein